MGYETIPFNVFMAASRPDAHILSAVDGGLVFFIGTGLSLLVLIALEKMGVTINETAIRWASYASMSIGFLALGWKVILLVM